MTAKKKTKKKATPKVIATVKPAQLPVQSNADRMIEMAINKDLDIEKLEKLMAMKVAEEDRQAERAFNEALAEMQPRLPIIEKATKGQSNNYASHEDIMSKFKPILGQYGFSLTYKPVKVDNGLMVVSELRHSGGHKEIAEVPLPLDTSGNKNATQAVGSTISYGVRYGIKSLLNVASANDIDDDDGKSLTPPPADIKSVIMADQDDIDTLLDLTNGVISNQERWIKWVCDTCKVTDLLGLNVQQVKELTAILLARKSA